MINGNSPIGFYQQSAMDYFNMQPSSVKGRFNSATESHKRYLYMKAFSVFEFKLAPGWALNWFRFWLYYFGSIAVLYTKEYGWVLQPYSVTKLDIYYNPAVIQVYNHLFTDVKTGVIGVNAEIIRMTDDYFSIDDLVTRYAEMLAQIDKDFNINLMNANASLIAQVDNKKQGAEVKEAYGEATTGKPLVVVNKSLGGDGEDIFRSMFPNTKQTYIGTELLEARRNVVNQFLTEIGIRNINNQKRAQQNNMEITENNDETKAIVSVMYDILKDCFEKVRKISGLDVGVEMRFKYDNAVGGVINGENDTMGDVSV